MDEAPSTTKEKIEVDVMQGDAEPYPSERLDNLTKWNIGACILHLLQAILQLVLGLTIQNFADFKLPVLVYYLTYDPIRQSLTNTSKELGTFGFAPFISLFFFLSAFFHFIVISPWFNKEYRNQLNNGKNYFRWIEYSVSSTLMIWLIAMLFGIYDLGTLLCISSLNASMNLCGLMMEKYNNIRNPNASISWFAFNVGCLTGFTPWAIIFQYLIAAGDDTSSQLPGFVWGVLIGYLIFFQSFPINMILQYKKVGIWSDYLVGEKTYIILSLVAKTFLGVKFANFALLSFHAFVDRVLNFLFFHYNFV